MSQDVAIDLLLVDNLYCVALHICLFLIEHVETHIALCKTNNTVSSFSQHLPQGKVIINTPNTT